MRTIEYTVSKHGLTDDEHASLRKFIQSVHDSKHSWKKYGFHFVDKTSQPNPTNIRRITVYFFTNDEICNKYNKEFSGLSVYDSSTHSIYFNCYRWVNGGNTAFSADIIINLRRYRIYVVNHEFGHALGLNHPSEKERPKRGLGSVMSQMTLYPKNIAPCEMNEWPLDKEVYDELKNSKMHYYYLIR